MTDIGEFELRIRDAWDTGIPLTDSMLTVSQSTQVVSAVLGLILDMVRRILEEAVR